MNIEVQDGKIDSFFGKDGLWPSELVIPEGVRSIGMCAFKHCSGIRKVVLPSTLCEIGDGAFRDCPDLEEVAFSGGNGLIVFGKYAFYRTKGSDSICNAIQNENKIREGRIPINTVDEALNFLNGRALPGFGIGRMAHEGGGDRYLQYMLNDEDDPGTGTVHYEVRRDDNGLIVAFHDERHCDKNRFLQWCHVVADESAGLICVERRKGDCPPRGIYVFNQIDCSETFVSALVNDIQNALNLLKTARDAHPWP